MPGSAQPQPQAWAEGGGVAAFPSSHMPGTCSFLPWLCDHTGKLAGLSCILMRMSCQQGQCWHLWTFVNIGLSAFF